MTAADVNLTELLARALDAEYWSRDGYGVPADSWETGGETYRAGRISQAHAALAEFRSPEVVAGIAGVLDGHIPCEDGCGHCICDYDVSWTPQHAARAVVEWIAGGGV